MMMVMRLALELELITKDGSLWKSED